MELSEWINPAYLDEGWISQARTGYHEQEPFPHLQLDDFLLPERIDALEEHLSEFEFYEKESDLFSLAQTDSLTNVDSGAIAEFRDLLNSDEFRTWMRKVTREATTPGKLDLFGAIYQQTHHLLPHDDRLEDRKIAFILYLTTLSQSEGGALALYDEKDGHPDNIVKRYHPRKNSIAFFTVSPHSWHEVEEVTADTYRVSLGGWLRC